MTLIYENQVKAFGKDIGSFAGADFIILFGDGAPDELKDYSYTVDVKPINGAIQAGQILKLGDEAFKITCVGDEAPVTLKGLGHCTIRFNGATEADLPGTIYVEAKPVPHIGVGTVIQIVAS
ncbi:PTS glucitol/sorbitol transporter subunit IIA [Pseudoramibacter alactolyticus]|jgi:PTS system glucitol/sorbitol-specific IIA component